MPVHKTKGGYKRFFKDLCKPSLSTGEKSASESVVSSCKTSIAEVSDDDVSVLTVSFGICISTGLAHKKPY